MIPEFYTSRLNHAVILNEINKLALNFGILVGARFHHL